MPVEAPNRRERRQTRRASTLENFRDWYENEGGQDVMERIRGLDLGEGQIFNRDVGPGRLSVNLPMEYGDPKVGSVADFMRDPQAWGDEAEQDQWDRALRASYTIPIGGDYAAGGRVGKRPRYMNEGGIASLMSNGGSEAMMLDLESAPNWAQKVHTNIVGGEWDDERDLLEDFTLAIPRAADAAVDPFLDFMDAYDELKDETEATAESMLERAKDLRVDTTEEAQQIMDEELQRYNPDDFGSTFPDEVWDILGGIVDPGKKIKGVTEIGEQGLKKARKMLNMPKYSPKGQDPRPSSLGTERSKPPELRYGGALSYKKGYYGKSYK